MGAGMDDRQQEKGIIRQGDASGAKAMEMHKTTDRSASSFM